MFKNGLGLGQDRLMWRVDSLVGGQQREQRHGDKNKYGTIDEETMSNLLKHRIDICHNENARDLL